MNRLETAYQYVSDVVGGKILVGKHVRKCVDRFIYLYDHGKDHGIIFREDKARHNLHFFNLIHHHKGAAARGNDTRLILSPWQAFSQAYIYGFYKEETNTRLVNEVYIEVAKKNGKTTMGSGNSSYMLLGDGEPGAEIYLAAPSYDQAMIAYKDMRQFIGNSKFSKYCVIQAKSTTFKNSFARPVSSDPKYLDGKFAHFGLLDEVHEHKNAELFENLKSGSILRTQPIIYMITTAGYNKESFCYHKRKTVIANLEGEFTEYNKFGAIYTIDEDDDYHDDNLWIKSNPQIGLSITKEKLREEVDSIENDPERYVPVLTKNMNIWVDAPKIWIKKEVWEKLEMGGRSMEDFRGCKAWGGLDLAISNDLTALVWNIEKDDMIYSFSHFYMPKKRAKEYYDQKLFNFFEAEKNGFCTITESAVTDYNFIIRDIEKAIALFNVQAVGCDPWNATEIAHTLERILGEDYNPKTKKRESRFVMISQRSEFTSPPSKILHRHVLSSRLLHDNNPIQNWCLRNTSMKVDAKDNWFPVKESDSGKIDGIRALIDAFCVQMLKLGTHPYSVYSERGIEAA